MCLWLREVCGVQCESGEAVDHCALAQARSRFRCLVKLSPAVVPNAPASRRYTPDATETRSRLRDGEAKPMLASTGGPKWTRMTALQMRAVQQVGRRCSCDACAQASPGTIRSNPLEVFWVASPGTEALHFLSFLNFPLVALVFGMQSTATAALSRLAARRWWCYSPAVVQLLATGVGGRQLHSWRHRLQTSWPSRCHHRHTKISPSI